MTEKWTEYYSNIEIKRIQEIELESLRVFEEICKKLNITFILYGGTLLGAVKYQGFVPWDDDLDIALIRKDYDKLIREGVSCLPDEYEIQHPIINSITPYPYIKFRRKDTIFEQYQSHDLKMNHGVYFDIYPIDNIPDLEIDLIRQHRILNRWVKLFVVRQTRHLAAPPKRVKEYLKLFFRSVLHIFLKLIPHRIFVNRMNYHMVKYNSVNTIRKGNYFFYQPVNYFAQLEPMVELEFEGKRYFAPNDYMTNLKNRYGDITQMPPENERIGHRPWRLELGSYR